MHFRFPVDYILTFKIESGRDFPLFLWQVGSLTVFSFCIDSVDFIFDKGEN